MASLGAISTILASYLAKVRGSGEPEFSTIHARELNTFLRDIEAFILDHGPCLFVFLFWSSRVYITASWIVLCDTVCACAGHRIGTEEDDKVLMYRERFESIIKTDGEGSGGVTGYSQRSLPSPYPPFPHPPPHVLVTGVPGAMDEKQMWRNEKAISGVV